MSDKHVLPYGYCNDCMEEFNERVTFCSVCGGTVLEMMYTDGHVITRGGLPYDYEPQRVASVTAVLDGRLSALRALTIPAKPDLRMSVPVVSSDPGVTSGQSESETEEAREEGLMDVLRAFPPELYVVILFAVIAAIILLTY